MCMIGIYVIGYTRKKGKNGTGPDGAVGVRYAAGRLEILDKRALHHRG